MKILLFCENKYAVDILMPLQEEADREGGNKVLWYVHKPQIDKFPLEGKVSHTNSIQEAYDFHPDAVYCPGNIVPYYLSGVKIQIFHGYAAEKKDHWIIRRYFDTYFTQGPYFTSHFQKLAEKYGDFEVLETGWTRQDWIKEHQHDFDREKQQLLQKHGRTKLVLYAPTFSPSLSSIPKLKEQLQKLAHERDALIIIKFHPLTKPEWMEEYKQLASQTEGMIWIDSFSVSKYIIMCDIMISDTSSTVYECLLQDKPVITLRTIAKDIYWKNITDPGQLIQAYDQTTNHDDMRPQRQWVIDNYDPHLDGRCAQRMLQGARDYIRRHGIPEKRKLNLWRKYTSIKTFGKIKKR